LKDFFIARQPIFDRRMEKYGYELLYRHKDVQYAHFEDGDLATSNVIVNVFSELGLENIVGKTKAFINLTRNFFLEQIPLPFPPQQIVIEVLEDIVIDSMIRRSIYDLSRRGYMIALDDVTCIQNVIPLLETTHIAKLDIQAIPRGDLAGIISFLKNHNIRILGEKIETATEFNYCRYLGMDYFQGYFFAKPQLVKGKSPSPAKLALIRLIAELQDPDVDFGELESLVAYDVSIGYKLLRLVNSSFYGFHQDVNSIRQAMIILGTTQLQSWLSMFLLSASSDKPKELSTLAMVRARMCELLAVQSHEKETGTFFMVGLLSALDAFMDLSMEQIIKALPISPEVSEALLHHTGNLGRTLECVLNYEKGAWSKIGTGLPNYERLPYVYLEAVKWVTKIESILNNDCSLELSAS
jgi:c-di-GMP phosphodiesterase